MSFLDVCREGMLDAWAVLAPTECSGCGAPDRAVCGACRAELVPRVHDCVRESALGRLTVWSALEYSGAAQRVIVGYKDGGRTDAGRVLGELLRLAVAAAVDAGPVAGAVKPGDPGDALRIVAIPSSRRAMRSRGFCPVELLLRRGGLRAFPALRQRSHVADQVGLGRSAREANKRGSMAAPHRLDGVRCVVVDDIVTTGATLFEARRAIHAAGGEVVGFATLAETPRRSLPSAHPQETPQQKL